jgi:SIR2-like domain/Putative ATP-dependent DNA helicase recG C-terminal
MQIGSIGRLYSLLKGRPRPVLLLGAGASVRSGIPAAAGVVERAARWAYAHEHGRSEDDPRLQRSDWLPWLQQHLWFDRDAKLVENYPAVVQHLLQPRHARAEFFRKLLSPGIEPSAGYDKLAEFLHQGLIHTVLTTNFDSLILDMRTLKGRPHFISAIQTDSDYTKFSTDPQYPQLVYLHGSVDHYTDKNIIEEVQRLDGRLVEMLLPLLRDRPLIVIGYRGTEPSVMQHLFAENAEAAHFYRHGIFWCRRGAEAAGALPPLVDQLAKTIGANFSTVQIEGFDELFARDLWALNLDAELSFSYHDASNPHQRSPTFDMEVTDVDFGDVDWSTLHTRILQYSTALQLGVPAHVDRAWITEQLFYLNLAARDTRLARERLTNAGVLLFGKRPKSYIATAVTRIKAIGSSEWLRRTHPPNEAPTNNEDDQHFESVIEGNLWEQFEQITRFLGVFNRPFRLKGEVSESVIPYPPLALKEVIVNALVHRDYRMTGNIVIFVTASSIKISNPGGLVEEVKHRVETGSIETEIRRGRRGLKGYRNPVLADLFYGSGEMDKRGSGLSDVLRDVRNNGGDVRFGPNPDNTQFEIEIYSRPEAVDEATRTASPLVATTSRYVANVLEITQMPNRLFHAGTAVQRVSEIWGETAGQYIPPFILLDRRFFSFHDLEDSTNPLSKLLDGGDLEGLSVSELVSMPDGSRKLVQLLNLSLEEHLYRLGLLVDKKRKRAYFPKTDDGPRTITYQARLRKATRTVVKTRISPRTEKVVYWEHEALSYRFEQIGDTWGLFVDPGYVFTFDGLKGLLAPERVNKLSTQRASRDYNSAVLNDISFWLWVLSRGEPGTFDLALGPQISETLPGETRVIKRIGDYSKSRISLASRFPTAIVTDSNLLEGDEVFIEETEPDPELIAELEEIAESHHQKAREGDHAHSD